MNGFWGPTIIYPDHFLKLSSYCWWLNCFWRMSGNFLASWLSLKIMEFSRRRRNCTNHVMPPLFHVINMNTPLPPQIENLCDDPFSAPQSRPTTLVSPFLCGNKSPIRYGFRAGARAFLYSVVIALDECFGNYRRRTKKGLKYSYPFFFLSVEEASSEWQRFIRECIGY